MRLFTPEQPQPDYRKQSFDRRAQDIDALLVLSKLVEPGIVVSKDIVETANEKIKELIKLL